MRWRRAIAALGAVALAWACSDAAKRKGEILLAIQTDVALPDSVDRLRIEISRSGVLLFGNDYTIGPNELRIPATLGIVEGDTAGAPVLIRVIARKGSLVKMLREVTTTLPTERVVTLRIPIRWLCDDSGKEVAPVTFQNAKCPLGQTCIGGECHGTDVDSSSLPEYSADDLFNGGSGKNDGKCFDVVASMKAAVAVAVDDATCTIPLPASDPSKINVGLVVTSDGVCIPDDTKCWVVLDRAVLDGWRIAGGRIQLPRGVCDRIATGRVKQVVTSTDYSSKTERDNICGCWSTVGSICAPVLDGGPTDGGGVDFSGPSETFTVVPGGVSLLVARQAAGGAVLNNGKLLFAGGWRPGAPPPPPDRGIYDKTAELFDLFTGTLSPTGDMSVAHQWGSRDGDGGWPVLKDGRVLIAGGLTGPGTLTAKAEVYEPATGKFTDAGSLAFPGIVHNPVVLNDGKVLFIGGWDNAGLDADPGWSYTGNGRREAQRFDPTTNTISPAGMLTSARLMSCNLLLPSGKVQTIGGNQGGSLYATEIEEYDPSANGWTTVGTLQAGHGCLNIYPLPNGKALTSSNSGIFEVYDPVTKSFAATLNPVPGNAFFPQLVRLKNGNVLAFGGTDSGSPTKRARVYDYAANAWKDVGQMKETRTRNSTVLVLPSGDVVIAGGRDSSGKSLTSIEIYHP